MSGEAVADEDAPPVRVIATAGHVDHGKSTLLRALTGMEPDRWREERDRGLTIDLGFVWTTLEAPDARVTIAFVDVPGHERFVGNMLAGAGAVRDVLLVVAADDGWARQSQEHLDVIELFDLDIAAVAITKVAVAGPARAEEVRADVTRRLAEVRSTAAPVVPVDGLRGDGLDELRTVLARSARAAPPPPDEGRARLWIDRVFSVGGAGAVVTGTLAGGSLRRGDTVAVAPAGGHARIRRLESLGRVRQHVPPGWRVAANLAGAAPDVLGRGRALVTPGAWHSTNELDAWVRALPGHELRRRGAWRLHTGSAAVDVEVMPTLGGVIGTEGGYVRLRLSAPLPLATGDRLVLRDLGRAAVAGGGEALDTAPPPRPRGADARLERAERLERVRLADDRLEALVVTAGARPRDETLAVAGRAVGSVPSAPIVTVADWLADADAFARWRAAAVAVADVAGGVGRDVVAAAAAAAGAPRGLADVLADDLVERGDLSRVRTAYATPAHADDLRDQQRRRRERLVDGLRAAALAPPPLERMVAELGVEPGDVQRLVQDERIVLAGDLAFAAEAVAEAVEALRRLEEERGPFTASQARETWGTSRRYAIPLLEHLDRVGITDFDGSTRRLRARRFAGEA